MEKRIPISFEAALLTALLALLALSLLAAPDPAAGNEVIHLSGRVHSADGRLEDAVLVVELDGKYCRYTELLDNGRFHMALPLDSKVRLHFLKPGHLPKVVDVDTRNALNTPKAERTNRNVDFEVVLETEAQRPGLRYDGPVGTIRFVNGTGTMKVQHDVRQEARRVITVER
jgi:hypothetical protein